ncbi:MAG TPA: hypothetical protein PK090_04400 [Smithellaceae bacterium]|nr:hypothetical protein [Smithellaceae bacterium]
MKILLIGCLAAALASGAWFPVFAADATAPPKSKAVAESVGETAREVKDEAVKLYQSGKEAVVRDAKEIKEEVPKGLKDARDESVRTAKEVKQGAVEEVKGIRDGLTSPFKSNAESK